MHVQIESQHKHLVHVDASLSTIVTRMRELNDQEALLGVPLSSVAVISRIQVFLEPFLKLWECHSVSASLRGIERLNFDW